MMNRAEISEYIIKILVNESHSNIQIQETSRLEELYLDSITFVKVIIMIEEQYNICFDFDKLLLSKYTYVSDIIDYILALISQKEN